MEIEVNGKTYRLHFKRRHVYQANLLKDITRIQKELDEDTERSLLQMHEFTTKLLLVGLQKFHADEFGCDNFSGDYSEQLELAEDLLDDFLAESQINLVDFTNQLLEALIARGIV